MKIILQARSSTHIDDAIEMAMDIARKIDSPVYLVFNDTEVTVWPQHRTQILEAWTQGRDSSVNRTGERNA